MMPWAAIGAIVILATNWFATGSIVVTVESSAVMPVALRLEGSQAGQWRLDQTGRLVIAGLAAGAYRVSPIFDGTIVGAASRVTVSRGQVTEVFVETAQLGGVRFDAEPGMCESDERWSFIGALVTMPDDSAPTGRRAIAPESPMCERVIAGLPKGRYTMLIAPPPGRLPPYQVSFTVQQPGWQSVRLPHPPVVVQGRVTFMGRPAAGARVAFNLQTASEPRTGSLGLGFRAMVPADADGNYSNAILTPGSYTVTGYGPDVFEPMTTDGPPVTLSRGINRYDFELKGGGLRVRLNTPASSVRSAHVLLTVHRTGGRPQVLQRDDLHTPVEVLMLAPVSYQVSASVSYTTADMQVRQLVSNSRQSVAVRDGAITDVTLDLIESQAELELIGLDNAPLDGASVRPMFGGEPLTANEDGRLSIASVPPGTAVAIRGRKWEVSCHIVTHAAIQRKVLAPSPERVQFVLPNADVISMPRTSSRPFGLASASISGVPGAECAIPFDALAVERVLTTQGVVYSVMLPRGNFTLELQDGRRLPFTAPGRIEVR